MSDVLGSINNAVGKIAKLTLDPGLMFASKLTGKLLDVLFPPPPEIAATNSGTAQSSGYGGNIPFIVGKVAIQGNIFWLENNKLKKIVHTTNAGGGKGGGGHSQKVRENLYYATFALGLGYIDWVHAKALSSNSVCLRLRRIWISNNLVFNGDVFDDGTGGGADDTMYIKGEACSFTYYSGKGNTPDPRMQATLGSTNVPNFNNLTYMVIRDLPLKQFSDTLQAAMITVELELSDYNTYDSIDSVINYVRVVAARLTYLVNSDSIDYGGEGWGMETVRGIVVKGDIRAVLDSLNQVFNYDAIISDYGLKAVYRSDDPALSVATIPWSDVGTVEGNPAETRDLNLLSQSMEMSTQQPRDFKIDFIDYTKQYTTNTVQSSTPYAAAVNEQSISTPIIMNESQASALTQLLRLNSVVSSDEYNFTLPNTYSYLEPTDIVQLITGYGYGIYLKISSIEDSNGPLKITSKPIRGSVLSYDSGGAISDPTPIPALLKTLLYMLDVPCLSSANNELGLLWSCSEYGPAMPGIWSNTNLNVSNDGEVSFTLLSNSANSSIVGIIADPTTLPNVSGSVKQIGGYLNLVLNDPLRELSSITEQAMLNGANTALYGIDGRWEVIKFKTAELQMDGSYNLKTFVRGCNGTEWTIGLHAANDIFVFVDPSLINFQSMEASTIEIPLAYRAVTGGMALASADTVNQTYDAVNLKPLSGCHAEASRSSGNITLNWIRRTRIDGSWRNGVEVALGESTESYSVDIMNGSTVVRTINSINPTIAYSAAQQTTDFGSPQSSVTFRIYQLSATVGRGYKYEVTL